MFTHSGSVGTTSSTGEDMERCLVRKQYSTQPYARLRIVTGQQMYVNHDMHYRRRPIRSLHQGLFI